MHCGFALMLGASLAKLVNFKPAKVFWALYPLVVFWVVMVTANHYFFDVVTGVADRGSSRSSPTTCSLRPGPRSGRSGHSGYRPRPPRLRK